MSTLTDLVLAVVDDDTVIREGVPLLLPDAGPMRCFPDIESLLATAPRTDVVLLDLVLAGTGRTGMLQGTGGVRAVTAAGHRALIYTNERRREVLAACLAAGARGIVHKAEPIDSLRQAIIRVADGGIQITPALTGLAELVERHGSLPTLTERQREILSARARGESFASIAGRMYISRRTAEDHMATVAVKFAHFLRDHSPADLERHLGVGPGDIVQEQN